MQPVSRSTVVSLRSAVLMTSATLALAALGFAAPALAAGSSTPACGKSPLLPCNRLAVTGPIAAAAGVGFPLKARGYADQKLGANPANEVVGWNTAQPCQQVYAGKDGELSTAGSQPNLDSTVKGRFFETYNVPASKVTLPKGSNQATMYWCVYLINSKQATLKAAFWTYTVLGHGGAPGGAP